MATPPGASDGTDFGNNGPLSAPQISRIGFFRNFVRLFRLSRDIRRLFRTGTFGEN